jgi:hypothetical protein
MPPGAGAIIAMAGLVAAIHVFTTGNEKDLDARHTGVRNGRA